MGIYYNSADLTFSVTLGCKRIKTTITDSSDKASSWIDEILRIHSPFNKLIVGLDIESCLHRKHGESRENLAALLQLCVGDRCLIFRLIHCDCIPEKLFNFLFNDKIYFVGAGIFDDVKKLELDYGLKVGTYFDLSSVAAAKTGRPYIEQWGLQELLLEFTEHRLEKPMRIVHSDWGKQYLELEQIEYAAIDAIASLAVGRKLLVELSICGNVRRCFNFYLIRILNTKFGSCFY
ncbi:hypothetical protein LUZ63_013781 [Rhynchospora breviuscula]|uniref:3'-5' exonuclease domain-containing protein n=1 Tax=Rhynchospora breviuscula TaxID=2022672 RepID=A0A9Q0C972_9POAL|nr:hypothetical protein LUZ63_013781 [Rhynchospora breviuscula]